MPESLGHIDVSQEQPSLSLQGSEVLKKLLDDFSSLREWNGTGQKEWGEVLEPSIQNFQKLFYQEFAYIPNIDELENGSKAIDPQPSLAYIPNIDELENGSKAIDPQPSLAYIPNIDELEGSQLTGTPTEALAA